MGRKKIAENVLKREVLKVGTALLNGDKINLNSEEYANMESQQGFVDKYDEWRGVLDKAFALVCDFAEKNGIDMEDCHCD